jgi:dihydroxyacetone synthase
MAMAIKNIQAHFNRPGFEIIDSHVWCMVGDACLQEGVALEAISLAGHMRLNNLTVIYDNNQITCDGPVSLTNTEDVDAKMRACGWNVLNIEDGCFDIHGIVNALNQAKKSDKPTFINVKTVIGLGSAVAGDAAAHGAAFGMQDVANMKTTYGFDREDSFVIPEVVRDFFADSVPRGQDLVKQWEDLFGRYTQSHPELAREFRSRMKGELPANWESLIPKEFPAKNTSTRASSGLVFNPIAQACKQFLVGTADLSPSVYMTWNGREDFEPRQLGTGSYAGRYIHYGVREHAMAAISNGIAAYHPGMFIPVTSSFFIFYLYAAPAVRMGSLQYL